MPLALKFQIRSRTSQAARTTTPARSGPKAGTGTGTGTGADRRGFEVVSQDPNLFGCPNIGITVVDDSCMEMMIPIPATPVIARWSLLGLLPAIGVGAAVYWITGIASMTTLGLVGQPRKSPRRD